MVLVVEDDEDLRCIFRDILRSAGYNVREASDGTQALRIIESAPPDALVLDVRLPTLDGISVREELASNAETCDIPIVIVTGAEVDAEQLQVSRVLRKPIAPASLLAAVRASMPSCD